MNQKVILEIDETALLAVIIMGLAEVDEDLAAAVANMSTEKLTQLAKVIRTKVLTEVSIGRAHMTVVQDTSKASKDN